MNAKQILLSISDIKSQIAAYADEIRSLRELATSITAPLDAEYVSSSGDKDKIGKAAGMIADLTAEILAAVGRLVSRRNEIIALIEEVPDGTYRELLHRRYVNGETEEHIADVMNYSYRWMWGWVRGKPGIHARAIEAFQTVIDDANES